MKKLLFLISLLAIVNTSFGQKNHVLGEIIAKVEANKVEDFVEQLNSSYPDLNVIRKEVVSKNADLFLFNYNYNNQSIEEEEILSAFESIANCEFAQWNHNNLEYRNKPNDPSFPQQWNLYNVGSEKAWDITTGGITCDSQEIVVAVVDESFFIAHDDLKNNLWVNQHEIPNNNLDDDNNGYIDDVSGWNVFDDTTYVYPAGSSHGTMVTGMFAATSNNRTDIASVNWKVKFIPIQGSSTIESVVLKSYDYLLSLRKMYNRSKGDSGAYIVVANSSFGVNKGKPQDYPAWCEMYNTMGKEGVISVGAGPNANFNVDVVGDIPSTCPSDYLVAVTSINTNDLRANSGYGKINMDIGAPGVDVISTNSVNKVQKGTGTSYAAPMVSGAVALMYSVLPKDTLMKYENQQGKLALLVRNLLLSKGVRKLDDLKGITTTDGTLDLYRCVLAAMDSSDTTVSVIPIQNTGYSLSVFPNPFSNEITISILGENSTKWNYSLVDITGTIIRSEEVNGWNKKEINLNNLSSGMYILHVQMEGYGVVSQRIIKTENYE